MKFNIESNSKQKKILFAIIVVNLLLIFCLFATICFKDVILKPNKKVDMVMDEIVQIERNTEILQQRIKLKKEEEENEELREIMKSIREEEERIKKIEKEANDAIRKYGIKKVLGLEKNDSNLQIRKIANECRNDIFEKLANEYKGFHVVKTPNEYKDNPNITDDDCTEEIYAAEFDFNDDGVNEIVWYTPLDCWHFGCSVHFIEKQKKGYREIDWLNLSVSTIKVLNHKTKGYYDIVVETCNQHGYCYSLLANLIEDN